MMAENEVFCDETFAAERRREARGRKGGAFWKWDERFRFNHKICGMNDPYV